MATTRDLRVVVLPEEAGQVVCCLRRNVVEVEGMSHAVDHWKPRTRRKRKYNESYSVSSPEGVYFTLAILQHCPRTADGQGVKIG